MELRVFDYTDPVEFLNVALKDAQRRNPSFSMRAWAKQLGLSHVAMLSMVLSGKRRLLPSLSSKISRSFIRTGQFDETQARYFDMLVLFANAASLDEKSFYEKILASLRPDGQFSVMSLDHFRVVSAWYHFAIVEMTGLKGFESDPRWISLRLGDSVNETQVREAIERLIRVGLLERTSEGRLRKAVARYATPSDIPNEAIRNFHSEMIRKAQVALERQSVQERDITAHIVTSSKAKIPQAKEMIRKFRRELADFLETPQGDAVYQLNVQLFNALGDVKNVQ